MLPDSVKLIECPRDAWQGLKRQIPASHKVDYLRALISAGFKHLDAVSFVSPKAVPQMADSEEVLVQLKSPANIEIIGIVVNEKGAERAIATNAVTTIGYPCSISETFLRKNQNQSGPENLRVLERIKKRADKSEIDMVAYISMAFGNPYQDRWSEADLENAIERIIELGIRSISIADTVGLATADLIGQIMGTVIENHGEIEIGIHMHSRPDDTAKKVLAAYDAGCRRFDSAIGGLGGCPFAQDSLVGNIPTESVVEALRRRGVETPVGRAFQNVIAMNTQIERDFG
ncbi:MAG TPA: hydroxymethylglutaryl-CoA lyase [Chthoniobacterales bacterium]|nr:hydroxymethylglutaryl-CoA lyase [Chthoniobacterales bacterium]